MITVATLLLSLVLAQAANGHVNGSVNAPVPRTTPGPSEGTPLRLTSTVPKDGSKNRTCRMLAASFAGGRAAKQSVAVELDTQDVTSHAQIAPNFVQYRPPSGLPPGEHFAQVAGKTDRGVPFELKWTFTCETGPPSPLKTAPVYPKR